MANFPVIDTDVHLIQKPDDSDVRPFMGSPYSDQTGSLLPTTGWDSSEYGRIKPSDWTVDHYHRAMDQEGIDLSVLFPTRALLLSQVPRHGSPTGYSARARDEDLVAAYCRGYNDYAASLCKDNSRLRAAAVVPFQNMPAAVAEAKRAVTELGLTGITLSSLGLAEHVGSPTYWPIYQELERLNVPLLVHNLSYQGPGQDLRADTFLLQDTVGGSMETFHACAALMYGGIPEKFPKLRIAVFGAGVGWVPFLMERMDKDFEGKHDEEATFLRNPPSQHICGGNWYFATAYDEQSLAYVLETIGENQILFGSAYPEADSLFPGAVANLRQRNDISEQAKRKILAENAKTLFGWS
ncbi:MAG: Amidohydrolase [Deltaproteobacteria bacterium]|nr:Amidohydrolase [Deltaproteobacteria bacterium]